MSKHCDLNKLEVIFICKILSNMANDDVRDINSD